MQFTDEEMLLFLDWDFSISCLLAFRNGRRLGPTRFIETSEVKRELIEIADKKL